MPTCQNKQIHTSFGLLIFHSCWRDDPTATFPACRHGCAVPVDGTRPKNYPADSPAPVFAFPPDHRPDWRQRTEFVPPVAATVSPRLLGTSARPASILRTQRFPNHCLRVRKQKWFIFTTQSGASRDRL